MEFLGVQSTKFRPPPLNFVDSVDFMDFVDFSHTTHTPPPPWIFRIGSLYFKYTVSFDKLIEYVMLYKTAKKVRIKNLMTMLEEWEDFHIITAWRILSWKHNEGVWVFNYYHGFLQTCRILLARLKHHQSTKYRKYRELSPPIFPTNLRQWIPHLVIDMPSGLCQSTIKWDIQRLLFKACRRIQMELVFRRW